MVRADREVTRAAAPPEATRAAPVPSEARRSALATAPKPISRQAASTLARLAPTVPERGVPRSPGSPIQPGSATSGLVRWIAGAMVILALLLLAALILLLVT